MSEPRLRRHKGREAPQAPSGYRQSRRGSGAIKATRRAERRHRVMTAIDGVWDGFKRLLYVIVQGIFTVIAVAIVLLLLANIVNTVVRWNAQRTAARQSTPAAQAERDKENVLIIGLEGQRAIGYLAMRVDQKGEQVFGIAIPDGAFVDIPGRGFERIGEAYAQGPDVALATVSNYFTVGFKSYIAVPSTAYKDALKTMSVSSLPLAATDSSLTDGELSTLSKTLAKIPQESVAIVPMPVKPIKLGDQTYFEPQRGEIADLLSLWWGVDASEGEQVTRVIVYNGAGVPGIAGQAAQQLIRSGIRVIDTKNADNFDYATTRIVVKRGDAARGEQVRTSLGVGEVLVEPSSADVTDVVVIIGKDYRPPAAEKGEQ